MQHLEHMRLDARRESNQSMNTKRQVEQNPAILQWKNLSMIGFHVLSIKHAVLVHLELGFVVIGISCYFHEPTNLQEAPTMMARGDMKSCCLELEASQSHITDLAASYSSMVRIFLSSEHATSPWWKRAAIAAMGLGWIIHQIHGSQCFSSSSGQNLSLDVLCFKHKDYSLKIMVQKISTQEIHNYTQNKNPWMDSKQVLKRCNFEWESYVPSWCFDGFNIKEPHVHLCVEHPTHDGIRLTGRQKIPWAADTLSFEKGTWFYVLCLNDGF